MASAERQAHWDKLYQNIVDAVNSHPEQVNKRDGSLICIGKGNEDWNYSAPHGAGRLMTRADAKNSISMAEYKDAMKGIFTSCVSSATIDESPMAYKPMQEIITNIEPTCSIEKIIKPVYNFKAAF